MDNAAPTFAPGSSFAGYRIESLAGRGGMGIVYRATQVALGRPVALKLLAVNYAADPDFRVRFKREWETAAAIDHPNVIPLYEAGEFEGQLFLAMRFVDGIDLANLIEHGGRVDLRRGQRLFAQIAAALDAAHARGTGAPRRQARERAGRRGRPRLPDRLRALAHGVHSRG